MRLKHPQILIIIILFLFIHTSYIKAQCYVYYGNRWSGNTVTYHINSNLATPFATQDDYETAINSAAEQWNNAGANFQFVQGDNVSYDENQEPADVFQVVNKTPNVSKTLCA